MSCISTKSLLKTYGSINAVDRIDLDIKSGQIFGFLGPNGAGKSTAIKLFTTLIRPTSGTLVVLGIDATKKPLDIRRKIGVVLQQPSYEPTLSVEKSLDKYGMMWDIDKNTRKKRLEELLVEFNLTEIRKKKNEDLSIGQRRRVQVAREFMHDMELLFLDEPTVGLDPSARKKLLDFLKNKAKNGLTIFYTTHVLTEAEYICDQIAIINKGRIITIDTPNQLKSKFGNEKIFTIHLSEKPEQLESLLSDVENVKIDYKDGVDITMKSKSSEKILTKVLQILIKNDIPIDDLAATSTSLEEIFLKVVDDSESNN